MEKQKKGKLFYFKVVASAVFAALVFALYMTANIRGEIRIGDSNNILCYTSVVACFVLSLLFIGKSAKKILVTLGLALNVVADYFLVMHLSSKTQLIGVCLFCGVQFCYALYSIWICKGIWRKIVNVAVRIVVTVVAYFVIQHFCHFETVEILSLLYAINCFITVVILLFYLKTEWLLCLGLFFLLACDVIVGIKYGAVDVFGISGRALEILMEYDFAFFCYIPGELFIALSSVWNRKRDN